MIRSAVIVAGALATGAMAVWLVRNVDPSSPAQDPIAAFLAGHWQHPLPPQGTPPAGFSGLEASLDSAACGQCHTAQYADWQQSLHSQTMTAGVLWQFRLMSQAEANACMNCHAPLAEQKALMALAHDWPAVPAAPPPGHVPETLGHQGLVCAACHVRQHERFGPEPGNAAGPAAPHGGATAAAAFSDSRFCASCHQFPDDGPRTAGKLREDTWQQWQASDFAARGETCQSCHMPDRRHQWRGIHDAEQVRQALTVDLQVVDGQATATLRNTGAGHYFPTYMVPKVTARLLQLAGDGEQLLAEAVIGWQVDVSLEHEAFDSRLPPGAALTLTAPLTEPLSAGQRVELRVEVAPREHYERTFRSVLDQAALLDPVTLGLLQQAYDEARATRYEALRLSAH